uniref:DNA-binding protein inhibitor ID-3-like n=1 Tax=Callithrix jacchus TaxID=9483 RepID=UPI0023DD0F5D|nr:DNA-binding protein inhibitor ID-3-like [Callithrix jacchus]
MKDTPEMRTLANSPHDGVQLVKVNEALASREPAHLDQQPGPPNPSFAEIWVYDPDSLAIARDRGKGPVAEEPLSLLDDMNHCYSCLQELTGIPRGTQLSQVEILQHVIDYILDLQVVLAKSAPGPRNGSHLPIQTAELAPELVISNDKRSFCH